MSNVSSAVKELEDLFSTKAKDNVIYFNDVNYTPIPRPITEAIKTIMADYPDLGYQIGLYSVKVFNQNVRPNNHTELIKNSVDKEIDSSTNVGEVHDDFVTCKISENDVVERLTNENGFTRSQAKHLLDKWKPEIIKQSKQNNIIKSSLSDFFPVSEEEAEEINDLALTFGNDKSELRSVLEDYFHIYDDYASMSVQDFDRYLADYYENDTNPMGAYED